MTPREIAAALGAHPIDGLTHNYGDEGFLDIAAYGTGGHSAAATVYLNADDLRGVFAVAGKLGASRLKTKEFWVRPETLRADLVEILAWSLGRDDIDPAAPETRAALRSPGLYGEVLRRHLEDRRDVLKALDFPEHRPVVAALSAALKETST